MIASLLLSIVLISLGSIHFNWVLGGTFGFSESLPTNEKGERVLHPKKIDSAVVGLGLTLFGIFYLFQSGIIAFNLPLWILKYAGWIIPTIFIIRAIGDFKYIGFFKKIQNTTFGKLDSKFYSPLCLCIGITGIFIQIFNK